MTLSESFGDHPSWRETLRMIDGDKQKNAEIGFCGFDLPGNTNMLFV